MTRMDSASSAVRTASPAPVTKVAVGPDQVHRPPASALASRAITPRARLITPKALPRSFSGAWSATSAAIRPSVRPMCTPHSAMPSITQGRLVAKASSRSATSITTQPKASSTCRDMRSDSLPAG